MVRYRGTTQQVGCVNHKKRNLRDQNAARGRLVGLLRPDDAVGIACV